MKISIAEAISDLLFVRDTVVVPGFGAFVKKPVSAKVNPVANYFSMPTSLIEFDANLREDNDLVVSYMSEKNDISEDEARRLLVMFVSDCFNSLKSGKQVVLNNIGTIFNGGGGELVFEQDKAVNYNADAFGLSDFSPEPVLRTKTKDEIKAEIMEQQKYKNTPVTVDEKAVHEKDEESVKDDDEDNKPHRWWNRKRILSLLLLVGIGFGLYYIHVLNFGQQNQPQRSTEPLPLFSLPTYSVDWDALTGFVTKENTLIIDEDNAVFVTQDRLKSFFVDTVPETSIRIIAGCFSKAVDAAYLANTLRNNGFEDAFYELRNKNWFVSFGLYDSEEEAVAALREIRANTDYKAWILK